MAQNDIEKRLWAAADELRANSKLKSSEYSIPVLGLIFLRYAESKFEKAEKELQGKSSGRRQIGKADYQAKGVMYLPDIARYRYLLSLPEGSNIGKAVNEAMKAIEAENPDLKDVLPTTYHRFENKMLVEILRLMSPENTGIDGDVFGKIYEYFLGNFAMSEGQKGGEFFTPTSIVQLIVEIIEPFHGRIYDPACGSGGMFVQSAKFVQNHKKNPSSEISVYGQERVTETVRLCKMNLAVHGLSGDIREANTYYNDIHKSIGKFDFVMANPPFNVDRIDKERIKDDPRFPYGLPTVDNGNYLWVQIFASALNTNGRAGFVMASGAESRGASEYEIRKRMISDQLLDVMVSIGPNMFYTVTLPCVLWFLDKGKKKTDRKDKVLFINARNISRQIDRAHRDFAPDQLEFLANIVRLYRGEEIENENGGGKLLKEKFTKGKYTDVAGLCKVATLKEIETQGWSLNPGQYVGVEPGKFVSDEDFKEQLESLNEELETLNTQARDLQQTIAHNVAQILK